MYITLATALTGWAAHTVRETTSGSDFAISSLVEGPTVAVLTCPGWMRQVYAPYLDALFQALAEELAHPGGRVDIEHFGVLESRLIRNSPRGRLTGKE